MKPFRLFKELCSLFLLVAQCIDWRRQLISISHNHVSTRLRCTRTTAVARYWKMAICSLTRRVIFVRYLFQIPSLSLTRRCITLWPPRPFHYITCIVLTIQGEPRTRARRVIQRTTMVSWMQLVTTSIAYINCSVLNCWIKLLVLIVDQILWPHTNHEMLCIWHWLISWI